MSFFRNLLKRFNRNAEIPAPAPEPAEAPTRIHVSIGPKAAGVSAVAENAGSGNGGALETEDCVVFPLRAITDRFTPELKAVLRKQPSEHVQVQIPKALLRPQLALGVARVTFAQLCAATPPVFLQPDSAPGDAMVELPLEIVVRQMTPSRREDQRPPVVPTNIPSIFGKDAAYSPAAGAARNGGSEGWYTPRRPVFEPAPETPVEKAVETVTPVANEVKGSPPPETAPLRIAPAEASGPISGPVGVVKAAPIVKLPAEREPEARMTMVPSPAVAADADFLAIPLAAVMGALPGGTAESVRGDGSEGAVFRVPMAEVDARMRTGRLAFKWGRLREMCNVALPGGPGTDVDVELPLAAVVPLYLATRKAPEARKQMEIDARIPDVFSKTTAASSEPESEAPVVAAVPEPAAAAAVPPTPAEVIERIRALDGVTGAFFATLDGLLVAGGAPARAEQALAAFAPGLFAQLIKFSSSSGLGSPESIDIRLEGTGLHLRKAGNLYLGVLTPRGEPAPLDQITEISKALQPPTH